MSDPSPSRQIVVHLDDVGNSHGANVAFVELFERRAISSSSVMVPCPWFPEAAAMARAHPGCDMGVHLTLTAEFDNMRWRPLTGVSGNGLTDAEGYFPRTAKEVAAADPAAVDAELRAQIDAALGAGIDVTHLDAHMGAPWAFLDIYVRLGTDYRLPVFLPRQPTWGMVASPRYTAAHETLDRNGNPRFSGVLATPFRDFSATADTYRTLLEASVPGLNWAAFHMTAPGDFAANSVDAPLRFAEYELFRSGRAAELIAELGLEPVGMRGFRDAMRT